MSSLVDDDDGQNDAQTDEYGNMHKLVLQGMMSAGFLDAKGVKKLFIGACHHLKLREEERTTMPYVQKIVREINERIRNFDMAIRSASCELTGKKFYIFLLTVEKPIMRFQNYFSKFEVEMFQKLMDLILRKYCTFSVPWSECLHLVRDVDQRASIQQGEDFINKMIAIQYFAKNTIAPDQDYEITLGVRTIREFEPILRDLYDDVMETCTLCKMLLLHGYRCQNCPTLIHRPCYSRYIAGSKNCPNMDCKANWSNEKDMIKRVRAEVDDGEDGQDDMETDGQASSSYQRLKKRWNKNKPPATPVEVDSDTDENGDIEMDIPMPVLKVQTPTSILKDGGNKNTTPGGSVRRVRIRQIVDSDDD